MNVPNILTLIRIATITPFLYFYLFFPIHGESIALIIFIFSGLSDLLDGFIARKYNLVTKIGTILDPLADKMMLISVLAGFVIKDKLGFWVFLVMTSKELLMILGALMLYNQKGDVISANMLGKISTVLFYIVSISIMINLSIGYFLMVIFLIINLITMCFYFLKFITIKKQFNR